MTTPQACYRKLRHYKYQLVQDYVVDIGLEGREVDTEYIALTKDGRLTVKERYAWDGPSGTAIDTRDFMRGSLVHDALYQLMREKHLDYRIHRDFADRLLQSMCLADNMWPVRAWWVYWGVRLFGEKHATPPKKKPPSPICVP